MFQQRLSTIILETKHSGKEKEKMITTSGPSRFIPTKKNIASSLNYVPSPLPPPPISGPVKSSNQPLIETALVSRFKAVCRPPLKSISETGHPSSTTFAVAGGQSRDEVQFYNIIDGFSAVAEGSEVEGITSGDTTSTSTSVGVGAQLPASIHSLPIDLVHIAPVSVAGSGEGEDDSSNCLVVTASKDSICAWQLDLSAANNNIPIFSKQSVAVLAEDLGRVEFISVMDQLVSVCVGTEVFVFNISAQTTTILEGHLGRVAAARFFKTTMHAASSNSSSESLNCYHRDIDINIVSISDDRTFKSK